MKSAIAGTTWVDPNRTGAATLRRTRRLDAAVGRFQARLADFGKGRLDAMIERKSRFSRQRSPRGPPHQLNTDVAFQRRQCPVDGLQRPSQLSRGRGLAAGLDDSQKDFDLLHRILSSRNFWKCTFATACPPREDPGAPAFSDCFRRSRDVEPV
ncbi:hypothetical protein ACVWW4_006508 [Bradyrhizobium sp. LB7.1]